MNCLYTNESRSATEISPLLSHALYFAERLSWQVFPAPPGEKKSYKSAEHSGGRKWGMTKNADEIRRDFEQWPEANIGVPTGEENGIFVIDIDTSAGHGKDGFASLAALEAKHGPLPDTAQAESPSGSRHYYFRWPGYRVKNSTSEIAPGIDVRGDGGMVIAPPSAKPGAGAYRWRHSVPIADAPSWLLDMVTATNRSGRATGTACEAPTGLRPAAGTTAGKALKAACEAVANADSGMRNDVLNRQSFLVGHYVGSGEIGSNVAMQDLIAACEASGLVQDDGERQCLASIQSGLTSGAKQPAVTVRDMFSSVATVASPPLVPGLPPCPIPLPDHPNLTERQAVALEDFYAYLPAHTYIFVPTREMWPASSVNSKIGQVSVPMRPNPITAASWLDSNRAVEQMTWAPGKPMVIADRLIADGGWIDRPGCTTFNLYRAPTIKPAAGDATPWLEHVRYVYGEETGHIVHWLAHRIQFPDRKINHALVLGGPQGIGKDTLLEPIKAAVGPWNFAEVSPQQMLGRFNGFVKSVVLRVSEARDLGDTDRYGFYEHMKTLTAAPPDVLRVDEKHQREHSVLNVCGVIITTNNKDSMHLPSDDRRHFVAWSTRKKEDFPVDYWTGLYRWFADGGSEIVAHHLAGLDLDRFDAKAPPPKTQAFWEIVDSSRAPEDAEMADALDALGKPAAVTLSAILVRAAPDFSDWLRDRKNRRKLPHRFEECGYTPVRNPDAADGLWKIGSKRQVVYVRRELSLQDQIKAAAQVGAPPPLPPIPVQSV